jgi:peptidoglycan hydrolase-like protein with peptidoglycan-binding domain
VNKFLIGLFALLAAASVGFGATKKRHTTVPAKSHVASSRAKAKGKKAAVTTPRRSYQATPTPERYKEIQQALAARGYFKGEVNGQWGPESGDALRRFQSEQNLEPDGKLGSLSLIAMGLGPKRMTAQAKPTSPLISPAVATPNQENQPNQSKEQP